MVGVSRGGALTAGYLGPNNLVDTSGCEVLKYVYHLIT